MPPPADASTIAVVGSGNLGLVYFTGHDHRLTVEELEELHPGLVAAVAAHPGRRAAAGPLEGARRGRLRPERARATSTTDRVEGEDPTALFGPHTLMSLRREDAMVHAPDLLLLSQYDPELGEVAAFEELIGSHGGLGGPQTEPFILHPDRVGARRGRCRSARPRSTATSGAGWARSASSSGGPLGPWPGAEGTDDRARRRPQRHRLIADSFGVGLDSASLSRIMPLG